MISGSWPTFPTTRATSGTAGECAGEEQHYSTHAPHSKNTDTQGSGRHGLTRDQRTSRCTCTSHAFFATCITQRAKHTPPMVYFWRQKTVINYVPLITVMCAHYYGYVCTLLQLCARDYSCVNTWLQLCVRVITVMCTCLHILSVDSQLTAGFLRQKNK